MRHGTRSILNVWAGAMVDLLILHVVHTTARRAMGWLQGS